MCMTACVNTNLRQVKQVVYSPNMLADMHLYHLRSNDTL